VSFPTAADRPRRDAPAQEAGEAPQGHRRLLWLGILVPLAVAAAVGWMAARPQRPVPVAVAPVAPQHLRVGPLDVAVPGAWHLRISPSGSAVEAALGVAYAATPQGASWDWLAGGRVDDRSLVPAAVRKVLAAPPRSPLPARLAGRPAWAYPDLAVRGGGHLALVVAPIASGVLLAGCEARRGPPPRPCGAGVLAISGARAVPPARDLALRLRGGPVLRTLRGERIAGARALRTARTAAGQAAAATHLSAAHRSAAVALAPLAPRHGAGRKLLRALHAATSAYARVARAARQARPAAYGAARRQAARSDGRLRRALAALA